MAVLSLGPLATRIRGSIGGTVFRSQSGLQIASGAGRQRRGGAPPSQIRGRESSDEAINLIATASYWALLKQTYDALTANQRAIWEYAYAGRLPGGGARLEGKAFDSSGPNTALQIYMRRELSRSIPGQLPLYGQPNKVGTAPYPTPTLFSGGVLAGVDSASFIPPGLGLLLTSSKVAGRAGQIWSNSRSNRFDFARGFDPFFTQLNRSVRVAPGTGFCYQIQIKFPAPLWSVETWVWPIDVQSPSRIIGTLFDTWRISTLSAGSPNLTFIGSSTVDLGARILLKRWNQILVSGNTASNLMDVYLNGALVASGLPSSNAAGFYRFTFGSNPTDTSTNLNGLVGRPSIWQTGMSAALAASMYNAARGMKSTSVPALFNSWNLIAPGTALDPGVNPFVGVVSYADTMPDLGPFGLIQYAVTDWRPPGGTWPYRVTFSNTEYTGTHTERGRMEF